MVLRKDWSWKMFKYLGYQVVDDDESLKSFNLCIKSIIQSERLKWQKNKKNAKYSFLKRLIKDE